MAKNIVGVFRKHSTKTFKSNQINLLHKKAKCSIKKRMCRRDTKAVQTVLTGALKIKIKKLKLKFNKLKTAL